MTLKAIGDFNGKAKPCGCDIVILKESPLRVDIQFCKIHAEAEATLLQVENYRKYVALLGEELESAIGMAWIHGWRSTPEKSERGRKLRLELGVADSGMDAYARDPLIEKRIDEPLKINVNGVTMELAAGDRWLSYEDVLKLAEERPGASVVFKGAAGPKSEGSLITGQKMMVQNGTIINAIQTGNA